MSPETGPFSDLSDVNTTTKRVLHAAWRAGLRPHEQAPEGGRRMFVLNGPGREGVFGSIEVGKQKGGVLRARLRYGNGDSSGTLLTGALAVQREMTRLADLNLRTGLQAVLDNFVSHGGGFFYTGADVGRSAEATAAFLTFAKDFGFEGEAAYFDAKPERVVASVNGKLFADVLTGEAGPAPAPLRPMPEPATTLRNDFGIA